MANYECVYRTNYFHVKDMEIFKEFISMAKRSSEDLNVYESPNKNGSFMIGGYGSHSFVPCFISEEGAEEERQLEALLKKLGLEKYVDSEDDIFFEALSSCVRDDDAILYKEGGHEKLRYVSLDAIVITSKSIEYIEIDNQMIEMARAALGNESWETKID